MRYVDGPTPGSLADQGPDADPEQVARTVVLRRLSAAARTRAELRTDLLRRGIPEEVADRVLDRFVEVGLVDDPAFAQAWVESRQRSKGTARMVLRQELRAKGVSDDDAACALASVDDDAERARAVGLAQVRLRSMQRLEPDVRRRRLVAMLMRRGYRQAVALSVVIQVMGEDPDAQER